jgi:hypothetical protein
VPAALTAQSAAFVWFGKDMNPHKNVDASNSFFVELLPYPTCCEALE